MSTLANFVYETGMLNRTPRSGLPFLGSGAQSVSEHGFRTLHIAWLLARLSQEPLNGLHLIHLVMFHDLPETRTGDFNRVYKKYDRVNDDRLYADLAKELPFGEEILAWVREFEAGLTPEARLARDADQLELIATLQEQLDLGNPRAGEWIEAARVKLKTESARQLANDLVNTPSDEWWFQDKHDQHWIDRGRGG